MIFIWGSKNQETRVAGGPFACPRCGPGQRFERVRVRRFFTLFFIPLFPLRDVGDYVECKLCLGTFGPEVLQTSAGPGPFTPGLTATNQTESDRAYALEQVKVPATLLMASTVLSLAQALYSARGLMTERPPDEAIYTQVVAGLLVAQLAGVAAVFVGALQMRKLGSYRLALAGSIVAVIPGLSACCLLGIPLGIWSLTVLTQPRVKAQFGAGPSASTGILRGL